MQYPGKLTKKKAEELRIEEEIKLRVKQQWHWNMVVAVLVAVLFIGLIMLKSNQADAYKQEVKELKQEVADADVQKQAAVDALTANELATQKRIAHHRKHKHVAVKAKYKLEDAHFDYITSVDLKPITTTSITTPVDMFLVVRVEENNAAAWPVKIVQKSDNVMSIRCKVTNVADVPSRKIDNKMATVGFRAQPIRTAKQGEAAYNIIIDGTYEPAVQ